MLAMYVSADHKYADSFLYVATLDSFGSVFKIVCCDYTIPVTCLGLD